MQYSYICREHTTLTLTLQYLGITCVGERQYIADIRMQTTIKCQFVKIFPDWTVDSTDYFATRTHLTWTGALGCGFSDYYGSHPMAGHSSNPLNAWLDWLQFYAFFYSQMSSAVLG